MHFPILLYKNTTAFSYSYKCKSCTNIEGSFCNCMLVFEMLLNANRNCKKKCQFVLRCPSGPGLFHIEGICYG